MLVLPIMVSVGAALVAQSSPPMPALKPGEWHVSNDNPKDSLGVFKAIQDYEKWNRSVLDQKASSLLEDFKRAEKDGRRVTLASGTRVKVLSEKRLRGPLYKEMAQFEILEGPWKGQKAWVGKEALLTADEYAALRRASEEGKPTSFPRRRLGPQTYDPVAGDRIYLAPQQTYAPSGLERVSSLVYVVIPDPAAYREWLEATRFDPEEAHSFMPFDLDASDPKVESKVRRLIREKKVFVVPINTEAEVQKVFPGLVDEIGRYAVQVKILGNASKGKVGWVNMYFASVRPYKKVRIPASPDFPIVSHEPNADDSISSSGRHTSEGAEPGADQAPTPRRSLSPRDQVSSEFCGAPTKDGTPCRRKVKGGGRCYQHR